MSNKNPYSVLANNSTTQTKTPEEAIKESLLNSDVQVIAGLNNFNKDDPASGEMIRNAISSSGVSHASLEPVFAAVANHMAEMTGVTNTGDGLTGGNNEFQLTDAQKTAVAQMFLSGRTTESFKQYHTASSSFKNKGKIENAEDLAAGLNVFNDDTLYDGVTLNVMYAPAQIAQSALAEAMFRTEVLTADKDFYEIRTLIPTLHNDATHSTNGTPLNFQIRRLVDAPRYRAVIGDEQTRIIPKFKVGREEFFVPAADVTPVTTTVNGQDVLTNYLRFGAPASLVSLNYLEDNPNRGVSNLTDGLDKSIRLEKIALKVSRDNGSNASVFELNAGSVNGSAFAGLPNVENEAVIGLNMLSRDFYISGKTLLANGSTNAALAAALALAPEILVRIQLSITGTADTETSTTSLTPTLAKVTGVFERGENGSFQRSTVTDPATLAAIANDFAVVTPIGFSLNARLANYNRRDPGIYCRVQAARTQVPIELNSPFSVRVPAGQTGSEVQKAELVKIAFVATQISNDMAAHDTFLEAMERMSHQKGAAAAGDDFEWAKLGYVADAYVTYATEEYDLDILSSMQNNSTASKLQDLTSLLALNITDVALGLIRDSGLNGALKLLGHPGYKCDIVVGCDPYVAGYLHKMGDSRTAGTEHKVEVISTLDERWRDLLTIHLRVTLDGDASILNFGRHLSMPRFQTDLLMNQSGATVQQVMIQTRRRYYVTNPTGAIIRLQNMQKAVRQITEFKVAI